MDMGRIAGVTAEETRDKLLNAAARVFATAGYEGATVAQIAREAGLSSGAIYAHYRSKAELLTAAVRAHTADEMTTLLASGEVSGMADVIAALGTNLTRRSRKRGSLLVEAIVAARRDPDVAAALAGGVQQREARFATLLRDAQEAGEIDGDVSADAIARFALMAGLGSLLASALGLPPTDPDEWSVFMNRLVDSFRVKEKV